MSITADSIAPVEETHQPIAGRRVIVTGGTSGIGMGIARVLGSNGATVLILGAYEDELDEGMQSLRGDVQHLHGLVADVTRQEDVERAFKHADQAFGGVDILVNNAGVRGPTLTNSGFEDWRRVLDVNVLGYFACAREAIDRMRRQGFGHIINIGSTSADVRSKEDEIYTATKAAVQAFCESLRKSINDAGVKITLIEPGTVESKLQINQTPKQMKQRERRLRMLTPEDIGRCVLYCVTQPRRCDVVELKIRPHLEAV